MPGSRKAKAGNRIDGSEHKLTALKAGRYARGAAESGSNPDVTIYAQHRIPCIVYCYCHYQCAGLSHAVREGKGMRRGLDETV